MKPIEEMTELEKLQQLEGIMTLGIPEARRILGHCVIELYRTRYELNCYHEGKIAAQKVDKGKGV